MCRTRTWPTFVLGSRVMPRSRVSRLDGQTDYILDLTRGILPGTATFTRASTSGIGQTGCTYIDANGDFQLVGADVPRFNCPFGGGAIRGLLIEGQRTNLCLRTAWSGNAATSAANTPPTGWTHPHHNSPSWATAPASTSTSVASTYAGSTDGASAIRQVANAVRTYLNQTFTCTSGVTYVMSVYVEAINSGSTTYDNFLFPNPAGGTYASATYYRNGVAVSSGDTLQAGRIFVVIVCNGTGSIGFRVGAGCQSNATIDVTMSRPQMEASDWPSSYIPTISAAITRPADFAYVPVGNTPCTGSLGTVVVGYYRGEGSTKICSPLGMLSSGADLIFVANHTGGGTDHDTSDGGTTLACPDGASGLNRAAFGWDAANLLTNASASVNGGTAATDALTMPTGLSRFRLGGQRSSRELGAEISYFAAYGTRKTDAELEALST